MKASSQLNRGIRFVSPVVIATAICWGCGNSTSAEPPTADLRVVRAPLVQRHLLTGAIEAVESVPVKVPQTRENRLQIQWLIPDGAMVSAGDRVLEFDNTSFTANLDQQRSAVQGSLRTLLQIRAQGEARLRESEAAVERARISLAKAELDASVPESVRSRYEHRNARLEQAKALVNHDKALADLKSVKASVEADNRVNEEQLRKAERELAIAEEAVNAVLLTAPREGIAVVEKNPWEDRKFQVGDTVFSGWTVVGIPDLRRLRVRASLSDVDDGKVLPGFAARCTPDIEPGLHLDGTITEITPIAREQRVFSERRGFDVVIDLAHTPDDILLVPGMSVRVEIAVSSREELLVPRAAVDLSSSPPRVRRRDGSWSEVRLGKCSAQHCALLDGLEEGAPLASVAGPGL